MTSPHPSLPTEMLKLRDEQLEQLDSIETSRFHGRLIQFIRDEMTDFASGMDNPALSSYVMDNQRRAATYGIETEQAVASFVFLSVLLGSPINEVPAVSEGLERASDRERYVELLLSTLT